MFLYLVAQAIFNYRILDNSSCSTNVSDLSESMKEELDAQMDGEHKFDESKKCVSLAFSGTFLAIGALACFIGLILSFCQEAARQGRVQQFCLAFSVAMACAAMSSSFWYDYSASGRSYHTFEPIESCTLLKWGKRIFSRLDAVPLPFVVACSRLLDFHWHSSLHS